MEIVQKYTLSALGRGKITALEDKVIYEFKSLVNESRQEFLYAEIDPKSIKGKSSDSGWSNIGWFFIVIFFCLTFIDGNRLFGLPILILAVISFAMLLRKREYVAFHLKSSGNFAFAIFHPDNNKEFVDYIIERVERANQGNRKTS